MHTKNRIAIALEIRKIRESLAKLKLVEIVKEKSENLRKKEKNPEKSGNFDRLSYLKSFTAPQVQIDDLSFC